MALGMYVLLLTCLLMWPGISQVNGRTPLETYRSLTSQDRAQEKQRCMGKDNGCCTSSNPCKEEDGDCDWDSQCLGDLYCGNNNCPWREGDDCCYKPGGPCNGQKNYCCTKDHPCKEADGDCDNNDECEGDLLCGKNNCPWGGSDDCCYKPVVPEPSPCGVENKPLGRISGGTETAPNQFPWMVRLPMGCGGSFITDKHILTAKHCVDKGDWRGKLVKISVHNQHNYDDYELVKIKDYVWPEMDEWQDIAIITLERSVDLSDNSIGTVCLPASDNEDYLGKKATAMGWGWTPDTAGQSIHLQKLDLTVTQHQSDLWLFTKVVFKDGVPLDVCRGDSGGPLAYNEGGRWTIIGTVQGGSYCNNHSGSPGRWNKVTGHLKWIKRVIGK